ncbi:hypothetical protein SVAN01_05914 [Stagonosporopsis vannaccii]|nr:hypothetical protein SVAN01_05914 [Stagonosporopsis vannaccii]
MGCSERVQQTRNMAMVDAAGPELFEALVEDAMNMAGVGSQCERWPAVSSSAPSEQFMAYFVMVGGPPKNGFRQLSSAMEGYGKPETIQELWRVRSEAGSSQRQTPNCCIRRRYSSTAAYAFGSFVLNEVVRPLLPGIGRKTVVCQLGSAELKSGQLPPAIHGSPRQSPALESPGHSACSSSKVPCIRSDCSPTPRHRHPLSASGHRRKRLEVSAFVRSSAGLQQTTARTQAGRQVPHSAYHHYQYINTQSRSEDALVAPAAAAPSTATALPVLTRLL